MRDRRKGGFLLAAGVIFVAVSVFVKDSYYANILRSWGIAWAVIGFLRLREYFYYKKPEHQAEYEEKETVARINRTDERKVLLRQMAGVLCLLWVLQYLLGIAFMRYYEKRL